MAAPLVFGVAFHLAFMRPPPPPRNRKLTEHSQKSKFLNKKKHFLTPGRPLKGLIRFDDFSKI
jgi:hypothetical protein